MILTRQDRRGLPRREMDEGGEGEEGAEAGTW